MSTSAESSFLTFTVGGHSCAIALTRVREIVGCRTVVRVPSARPSIRGVMNLRGTVVPVVDLARHLGIGETTLGEDTCAVLIDTNLDGDNASLAGLVQEIHGVADLVADALTAAPQFGTPLDPHLLAGVATRDSGLSYVLDVDRLLESLY